MSAAALTALTATLFAAGPQDTAGELTEADARAAAAIVDRMKSNPRGPYERVAWRCADGTVQPPKAFACKDRGGGLQHGLLSADAGKLGELGIHVGTVLAAVDVQELLADDLYRARALVVERFLEQARDGWVLHAAKGYRGARQIEDEEVAARRLLEGLLGDDRFGRRRALAIRLLRSLPYEADSSLGDAIRAAATVLGDADRKFDKIRAKIHSMPEVRDADAVAAYARTAPPPRAAEAKALEAMIRRRFDPAARKAQLLGRAKRVKDAPLARALHELATHDTVSAGDLIRYGADVLRVADEVYARETSAARRLILLDVMTRVEALWVGTAAELSRARMTRSQALDLAGRLADAAGRLGHLSPRERDATLHALERARSTSAAQYASGLQDAQRALEWARARLVADLWLPVRRYHAVEPGAHEVVDDVLRSSMLLPLATLFDRLSDDVERLRPGGHRLLGLKGTASVRGDNPGIAIAPLRVLGVGQDASTLKRNEVVLLREVPPNLPPVAGLITVGSESMLSHVALLAQNLGLPQASVGPAVAQQIERWASREIVLGVSATRRVALGPIEALSGAERALLGPTTSAAPPALEIDAARLDLTSHRAVGLGALSEKDAGVRVGPKAAELARLKRLFPARVSDAMVLPFGAFVRHVARPGPDGISPLARLQATYGRAKGADAERIILEELDRFRAAIATLPFPEGFEADVRGALARLGAPGSFGVFVRSDTNVEDLKDFTGAGLNLTVANRVRPESILAAIRAVWASPYSPRSYQWRQRLLANPEHVYPSVLLHRTVPSEASGVLVTTDVERGGTSSFTVSTSEGVASVVDGGAAETIVVEPGTGSVRLLSSSRVATRKVIPPPPAEGVVVLAAEGSDPLLGPSEVAELTELVREVETKIGRPTAAAWDIEFGFAAKKLYLMQIRPLKRSRAAGAHPFLEMLDEGAALPAKPIDLDRELP